jgi:H+/gluconate symporter-like permease
LAGIIIAAVVGTIIILVVAILLYKRRQKKRAATQQSEEETDGAGNDEKDVEVGAGPVVPGEMTYASQPANLHSDRPGASIPEQPKVVGPGADRAVVDSNK